MKRTVKITRPTKNANQSPWNATKPYVIQFINYEKDQAWVDPLMGWTSSTDPLYRGAPSQKLQFETLEQAIYYAESMGM